MGDLGDCFPVKLQQCLVCIEGEEIMTEFSSSGELSPDMYTDSCGLHGGLLVLYMLLSGANAPHVHCLLQLILTLKVLQSISLIH